MGDDADAIARAKAGDSAAFASLVRKYQRRVYATAYHIMGNHGDADDVAQDAFIRAYRGLATFEGRSDLFTWLYRITVNTSLNHLRSRRRATTSNADPESEAVAAQRANEDPIKTPEEWSVLSQRVRHTLLALCELSPTLRVTLVLATVEGLPYREIAEVLEIPEGTVAWRVNEARKQLRARLEAADGPGDLGDDTDGDEVERTAK
jgi:RNA polymerase sigma-70 factor (ECF subfamily)